MKKIATRALLWILSLLARITLERYHPRIIAITGSVGKTTVKEMTAHLLGDKFRVGKNLNNINTEWGITATIIDPDFVPLMTSDGWAKITLSASFKLIGIGVKHIFSQSHKYPDVLVLELAVEKPGDMIWFNRWLKYDVAIIISIGHVHQEFFTSHKHLQQEKLALINGLKHKGLLIINENLKDDVEDRRPSRTLFFAKPKYQYSDGKAIYSFETQAGEINIVSNQTRPIALSAPVAAMVAIEFGLNNSEIKDKTVSFKPLKKRFDIHSCNRGITLIDDAYNANPDSMKVAILGLGDVAGSKRKVAILGEMRELGDFSRDAHLELGGWLADKIDLLIVVGDRGELIARGAKNHGLDEAKIKILSWPSEGEIANGVIGEIGDFYSLLIDNDVVLVKSSKTIGLSKLAESLLIQLS